MKAKRVVEKWPAAMLAGFPYKDKSPIMVYKSVANGYDTNYKNCTKRHHKNQVRQHNANAAPSGKIAH